MKKTTILVLILFLTNFVALGWGFFAHKRINRLAVFCLPPEMVNFYKRNISYITDHATDPDSRRNMVKDEACRHYIDIDIYDKVYGDSAVYKMPRYWKDAVEKFSEDTLKAYGIVPWQINLMKYQLTQAFKDKNAKRILKLSADIGHYIGDANVPLHTTENYNGQRTGQVGIHGFWESRLPELFSDNYDFFVGQASYLKNPQLTAWEAVTNANRALDSVLRFEKELTKDFGEDKKFTMEERNKINMRTYSREFSSAYHKRLDGQVERRFRAALKMVADFWYTAWVDGGQPNLDLLDVNFTEAEMKEMEEERLFKEDKSIQVRPHDNASLRINTYKSHDCGHDHNENLNQYQENPTNNYHFLASISPQKPQKNSPKNFENSYKNEWFIRPKKIQTTRYEV